MSFVEVYSDEQREAIGQAINDRGIRPARRVAELARRGELELDSVPLEPFEIPVTTVRDLARKHARRRSGQAASDLAKAPAGDVIEALQRRLLNVAERGVTKLERQKRDGMPDYELMRQATRCLRELKALGEPRVPPPAAGVNGGAATGGLGASILAAARRTPGVAPEPPPLDPETPETPETPAEPLTQRERMRQELMDEWNAEVRAEQEPDEDRDDG